MTVSDRSISESLKLLSTDKVEYGLDHLLFLVSGQESRESCMRIANSGDLVFDAFVKSSGKQRLNLSCILVSCARISENAEILLEKVLTIDNLPHLLDQVDVKVLSHCGELIGKVFEYSLENPVELSRSVVSLLVDEIKEHAKNEKMERCVLGVLLNVLCRAEVSRVFIEDHFSILLELASSSCKPMVPIILSQLFGQFEEAGDQIVQDASLK
jgi:hypothetical protein